jgi:hypothetical protein
MPFRYTFRRPKRLTERATDQQERGERQGLGGHHPLQGGNMTGSAMLTTVASSGAILEPGTVTASTHRHGAEE